MEFCYFFFFNDTANTEIFTLTLHDALPIFSSRRRHTRLVIDWSSDVCRLLLEMEEQTSELQSLTNVVCRLLLEKKQHTSALQLLTHIVCSLLIQRTYSPSRTCRPH